MMWKKVSLASLTDTLSKYCDNCNCDTIHNTIKDIWQQPNITTVRVNCFKQLSSGRIQKTSALVNSGDTLTVLNHKAEVIRVIFHIGSSTNSGHYTSATILGITAMIMLLQL